MNSRYRFCLLGVVDAWLPTRERSLVKLLAASFRSLKTPWTRGCLIQGAGGWGQSASL